MQLTIRLSHLGYLGTCEAVEDRESLQMGRDCLHFWRECYPRAEAEHAMLLESHAESGAIEKVCVENRLERAS